MGSQYGFVDPLAEGSSLENRLLYNFVWSAAAAAVAFQGRKEARVKVIRIVRLLL